MNVGFRRETFKTIRSAALYSSLNPRFQTRVDKNFLHYAFPLRTLPSLPRPGLTPISFCIVHIHFAHVGLVLGLGLKTTKCEKFTDQASYLEGNSNIDCGIHNWSWEPRPTSQCSGQRYTVKSVQGSALALSWSGCSALTSCFVSCTMIMSTR